MYAIRSYYEEGRKCLLIPGDIGNETFAKQAVQQTVDQLGGLDILVNNAGEQHPQQDIAAITSEQLEKTFRTNVFGMFYLTQAALPVITSYSIHYTKLYDGTGKFRRDCLSAMVWEAANSDPACFPTAAVE